MKHPMLNQYMSNVQPTSNRSHAVGGAMLVQVEKIDFSRMKHLSLGEYNHAGERRRKMAWFFVGIG